MKSKAKLELLTTKQASEYLQVHQNTLANWRCAGRGPKSKRIGGRIRYDMKELNKIIN